MAAPGGLTTHVLDTARGAPAAGVRIELFRLDTDGRAVPLRSTVTNADGRTDLPLLSAPEVEPGRYELRFHLGAYFHAAGAALSEPPFLDVVPVRFAIADAGGRYHVPLLASPWSYTTYRGS